jgi:regulatory protein
VGRVPRTAGERGAPAPLLEGEFSRQSSRRARPADAGRATAGEPRKARGGLSLKGRALRFLARREHSRAELRGKLLAHAENEAALDLVLDDLEATRLLSDRRFAEVVASSKGSRFGHAILARNLSLKGVAPDLAAEALAPLRGTERERALELCRSRFEGPPADLRERARQHRFLLGRGFDPGTVSWVLRERDKGIDEPGLDPGSGPDQP